MDPTKMMELQRQMVQNNADIQDYLKGLDNWEDEIRIKDKSSQKESTQDTQQVVLQNKIKIC